MDTTIEDDSWLELFLPLAFLLTLFSIPALITLSIIKLSLHVQRRRHTLLARQLGLSAPEIDEVRQLSTFTAAGHRGTEGTAVQKMWHVLVQQMVTSRGSEVQSAAGKDKLAAELQEAIEKIEEKAREDVQVRAELVGRLRGGRSGEKMGGVYGYGLGEKEASEADPLV